MHVFYVLLLMVLLAPLVLVLWAWSLDPARPRRARWILAAGTCGWLGLAVWIGLATLDRWRNDTPTHTSAIATLWHVDAWGQGHHLLPLAGETPEIGAALEVPVEGLYLVRQYAPGPYLGLYFPTRYEIIPP